MAKKPKGPKPPICPECETYARLTDGAEIYPHRDDLHDRPMWICDGCGGYVGCHPNTKRPLGTPAGPELRRARSMLHERMIDPLWQTAIDSGGYEPEDETARHKIISSARSRVYRFLAARLGIERAQCHTGMFDITTCRDAWRALQGVTYPEIRAWAHAQKEQENDHHRED